MTGSFWQRLVRGARRWHESPAWRAALGPDWHSSVMGVEVTDDFHAKQGRSTGRWLVDRPTGSLAVYLKRHYRLPWWRGVLATFVPWVSWSPAWQECEHLRWAAAQGLPVPDVAATAEWVGPWFRLQSCLAIGELRDMLGLHHAVPRAAEVLPPADFARWKRGLVRELARLARELHRRSRYHKDLYLCHFYLPRADAEAVGAGTPDFRGRLHMIDFHRLGHHPLAWGWWQVKDLAQLAYSSEIAGVTARDRLRFWRLYRGYRGRGWATRLLEWPLRVRWWNFRRHNAKHEWKRLQRPATGDRVAA